MAKHPAYTGKYDNKGAPDEDVEVAATEVPAPGTATAPIPAGLAPEEYMTAQEKHVADGGEYQPPEDETPTPESDAAKAAKSKAKKEEK